MPLISQKTVYPKVLCSGKYTQYGCAVSGILSIVSFFLSFAAMGFIPPKPPSWTGERLVQYLEEHHTGINIGVVMIIISSGLYLPLVAGISYQINRNKNIHPLFSGLQLCAGASGVFALALPGVIIGLAAYRLDRDPEITRTIHDFFWFTTLMPWPTFLVQNWAFSFSVIIDSHKKGEILSKYAAMLNMAVPILFFPTLGMHAVYKGPVAFDGVLTFWFGGGCFVAQVFLEAFCLMRLAYEEEVLEKKTANPWTGSTNSVPPSWNHADEVRRGTLIRECWA